MTAINGDENYFGSHCETIVERELDFVWTYISALLRVSLTSPVHPLLRYYLLNKHGDIDVPDIDGQSQVFEKVEMTIRDLSGRLFWVSSFGTANKVSWNAFSAKFTDSYGDLPSERLDEMRILLVDHTERLTCFGQQDQRSCEDDVSGNGIITLESFQRFLEESTGLFQAFQRATDPGTVVLCVGLVDDAPGVPVASSFGSASAGRTEMYSIAGLAPRPGTLEDDANVHCSPVLVKGLLGHHIVQIACGGQHVAVLSDSGRVFTWGRGGFGRLGHGHTGAVESPTLVDGLKNVKVATVCCGFAYTAAADCDGLLYTWGAGENGRLGHGDASDRISPTVVAGMSDWKVTKVYAGSVHTCILTSEGLLFGCGKFEYTGHGRPIDVLSPLVLDFFDGIPVKTASVGPGGYHTIALTVRGDVYTWGHNRVGQLGHLNSNNLPKNEDGAFYVPQPLKIPKLPELIEEVVAGWGHTGIIGKSGRLYVCGRNVQGQLGIGDPRKCPVNERGHHHQPEFCEVQGITNAFRRVKQLACGGEHTAILFDDNDVATMGSSQKGQLGHGTYKSICEPTNILSIKESGRVVTQIACGNYCSLILAGRYQPIPLRRLCAETIRRCPEIMNELFMESDDGIFEAGSPIESNKGESPGMVEADRKRIEGSSTSNPADQMKKKMRSGRKGPSKRTTEAGDEFDDTSMEESSNTNAMGGRSSLHSTASLTVEERAAGMMAVSAESTGENPLCYDVRTSGCESKTNDLMQVDDAAMKKGAFEPESDVHVRQLNCEMDYDDINNIGKEGSFADTTEGKHANASTSLYLSEDMLEFIRQQDLIRYNYNSRRT
jgi:alpha-tubulin suppressor-like RCC1 family protein